MQVLGRSRAHHRSNGASKKNPVGRRRTRRTDRLVWVVAGILAVYSLVLARGMIEFSQYRSPAEIFPFYHWDLFSRVPEPVQDYYGIRFTRLYGAALDEPIYYEDSVLPNHQSSSAHALIQRLGAAVVNGEEDKVSRYETILESRYLEPLTGAEYELVDRRYDIAERLECDCYIREDVLAQFTMGAS